MKKTIVASLLSIILLTVGMLSGCARPVVLEAPETREYGFSGFTAVEVGHTTEWVQFGSMVNVPVSVELTRSDTYSVTITANRNIYSFISVSKEGGTLRIIIDRQRIASENAVLKARISVPELSAVKVSGLDMTASVFSSAPLFRAQVSGAGSLDMDLQAGNVELDLSSASRSVVRGSVQDLNVQVSGSAELKLDAPARDVDLRVSSAAQVTENGSARNYTVRVSGSGTLETHMKSGTATFELSSASRVTGDLTTGDVEATLSGASRLQIKGSGANATIKGSSASKISLPEFKLSNASVTLSGASEADINVTGKLDIELGSASTLNYTGSPVLGVTRVSGGADLNHR